jgi:hypothetical protein
MNDFKTGNPGEGLWKFVRVGGQYRFINAESFFSHRDCVNEGEQAESAGMIRIDSAEWEVYGRYSYTLKVTMDEADSDGLTKLLGLPERKDF